MSAPLPIRHYYEPDEVYYCLGFLSADLSDLARQLVIFGHGTNERIKVTDESGRVEAIPCGRQGLYNAGTIGQLLQLRFDTGCNRIPANGRPEGWLGN